MGDKSIIIPVLFFYICANYLHVLVAQDEPDCYFTDGFSVYVFNKLPPNSAPLKLHCASKDDDLGNHTLSTNQHFQWKFCENVVWSTLYFCHLWWDSMQKALETFNSLKREECDTGFCLWVAKTDGIYFTNGSITLSSLTKKFDWDISHAKNDIDVKEVLRGCIFDGMNVFIYSSGYEYITLDLLLYDLYTISNQSWWSD
ncbi:plant self-incompatibility protein S1 family [Striga asiatica]|uniref:S-protein homolog n=1 Tax=Striga asiatica TaxID=4170 RepID=A0A5A7P8I4_STRAF|nr:plant self-incompatibility protein S1 family [Striga asiatica]